MYRKWPIYILKMLLENLDHAQFSFHTQSQFLHISPLRFLHAELHKNCCTPSIDLKTLPPFDKNYGLLFSALLLLFDDVSGW